MAMYMKDIDGSAKPVGFVQTIDKSKWKLLGETEITQEMIDEAGEEGITAIVLEFDPITEWYGETWIRVEFGATKDLNTANSGTMCGFGNTVQAASFSNEAGAGIIRDQSGTAGYAPLWVGYKNIISLFTNWYNNNPRGTIYMNNAFNARNYPTNCFATSNNDGNDDNTVGRIIGCKYLWFGSASKKFKFPTGTKLKLFGRF